MKRLIVAGALALALAGCVPAELANIPAAPVAVADRTVLDERAALSVELAYSAAGRALELALDAGLVRGQAATTAAAAERRAYAAVLAARAAYDAGNARTYATAIDQARAAVAAVLTATKGS
jgi:hypothetical protein